MALMCSWQYTHCASYVLFPAWFLGFCIIYIKYTRNPGTSAIKRIASTERTPKLHSATN